jgi:hypothetical protein
LAGALSVGAAVQTVSAAEREPVLTLGDFRLLGSGPSRAVVGVGAFNAFGYAPDDVVPAAHAELMYGGKIYGVGPLIGVMTNTEGGVFGFGGLYLDVRIGKRFVATPFLGVGAYHQSGSRDLDGVLQLRPSFTVAYELDSGIRVGLNYAHISNAGIHDTNPSDEEFHVTLSFPLPF